MLVRVLKKRIPRIGKQGETRDLSPRYARLLITLGLVSAVEEVSIKEPARRKYVRRDMQAESDDSPAPRKRRQA